MKIGTIIHFKGDIENFKEKLAFLVEAGLESFQLDCWDPELLTDENADLIRAAAEEAGVEISALWCGYSGPRKWNFTEGPTTLGLVPPKYRHQRTRDLIRGCAFAERLGTKDIVSHFGFIPVDPASSLYRGTLAAIKRVGVEAKRRGLHVLFETGQETPITLMRVIADSGLDNFGINLDPANLILYGMANPLDAAEMFGSLIRGVHGKDGLYPTDPHKLGRETALMQGKVNYPELIRILHEIGYCGSITIEREISGEQQLADIRMASAKLREIIASLEN